MTAQSDPLIVVIGRGGSGTRMLSHMLSASGVFMGRQLNPEGDLIPPQPMYQACILISQHVQWEGGLSWNFDRLQTMQIDPEFEALVHTYLEDVLASSRPRKGWKLPETTVAYPWIARMFPQAIYVHLVRDPRDSLLSRHLTDDLGRAGLSYPPSDDVIDQRVASWKYQHEIVKATPRPERFISIRYEDLVLEHEATVRQLETFLGFELARIPVDRGRIGKWKAGPAHLPQLRALDADVRELGYEPFPADFPPEPADRASAVPGAQPRGIDSQLRQ